MCAVRTCVSYLCITLFIYSFIYLFILNVMSVMYVKINVIIVRQEIEINSD